MGVIQRVVKPKTQRGKRNIIKRGPKLIENTKTGLFLRGKKCSQKTVNLLKDLARLKKPNSLFLSRKKDFLPFENTTDLEKLLAKHDSSHFGFGSQNKKRPNNIVLGRTFDGHVMDMIEFDVERFKGLDEFKGPKWIDGSKPLLNFCGEWTGELDRVKNFFIDLLRGEDVEHVGAEGIDHIFTFIAANGLIYFRGYRVNLMKSGSKTPAVELAETGPSFDLKLRRSRLASSALFKQALTKPKQIKNIGKKKKNIEKDGLGTELGRIHIPRQKLDKLPLRKMKGLKRSMAEKKIERADYAKRNSANAPPSPPEQS